MTPRFLKLWLIANRESGQAGVNNCVSCMLPYYELFETVWEFSHPSPSPSSFLPHLSLPFPPLSSTLLCSSLLSSLPFSPSLSSSVSVSLLVSQLLSLSLSPSLPHSLKHTHAICFQSWEHLDEVEHPCLVPRCSQHSLSWSHEGEFSINPQLFLGLVSPLAAFKSAEETWGHWSHPRVCNTLRMLDSFRLSLFFIEEEGLLMSPLPCYSDN